MRTDHTPIAPPPMLHQFLEARAGAEFASLMLMLPLLRMNAPRGNDRPVIVLPGFMANDNSTWVLRRFLEDSAIRSPAGAWDAIPVPGNR